MKIIPTEIEDVLIIEPTVFGDDRGFFMESWNARTFAGAGLDLDFVQDNHSCSSRGVLRGLHYQQPGAQGKLVRAVTGAVFDAVVDLRENSPSFGRWVGVELSGANRRMLWVPPGMAHGFLCLEDNTNFVYKCTAFYNRDTEYCLLWNDPDIGIEWPLDGMKPLLSEKDAVGTPFREAVKYS